MFIRNEKSVKLIFVWLRLAMDRAAWKQMVFFVWAIQVCVSISLSVFEKLMQIKASALLP